MSKAINVIMRWYRDLPAGQLTPTIMELQSYQGIWPSEFEEVDNSRRYVAGYFQSVYNLWQQTHLLDDKTASGALDVVRLKIYLQYIEP